MITQTRHPILLAKEVLIMTDIDQPLDPGGERSLGTVRSMHGHLSGQWIEEYGHRKGLEKKPKSYFWTRKRWDEHRRGLGLDHPDAAWKSKLDRVDDDDGYTHPEYPTTSSTSSPPSTTPEPEIQPHDYLSQGTVGAVCLDTWDNLAVATSTGGLTNKQPGRIGDTPSVGAGFWAESWDENVEIDLRQNTRTESKVSGSIQRLLSLSTEIGHEVLSHLTSCLPFPFPSPSQAYHSLSPSPIPPQPHNLPRRRALALSGTGNGDSFLRLNATRTVASISRFSSPLLPLSDAITLVIGPNGLLQQSAESRWGDGGGEGEGEIIGIEVWTTDTGTGDSEGEGGKEGDGKVEVEARTVFDFNCGGIWRAYHIDDGHGGNKAVVDVFREPYH